VISVGYTYPHHVAYAAEGTWFVAGTCCRHILRDGETAGVLNRLSDRFVESEEFLISKRYWAKFIPRWPYAGNP
jgi:hypothetical protein